MWLLTASCRGVLLVGKSRRNLVHHLWVLQIVIVELILMVQKLHVLLVWMRDLAIGHAALWMDSLAIADLWLLHVGLSLLLVGNHTCVLIHWINHLRRHHRLLWVTRVLCLRWLRLGTLWLSCRLVLDLIDYSKQALVKVLKVRFGRMHRLVQVTISPSIWIPRLLIVILVLMLGRLLRRRFISFIEQISKIVVTVLVLDLATFVVLGLSHHGLLLLKDHLFVKTWSVLARLKPSALCRLLLPWILCLTREGRRLLLRSDLERVIHYHSLVGGHAGWRVQLFLSVVVKPVLDLLKHRHFLVEQNVIRSRCHLFLGHDV